MTDITVLGIDGSSIGLGARVLLEGAELVVGGWRHLLCLGIEAERAVVLKGDLSEALDRIEKTDGRVVVLASGDPGFFGIVRLLAERFGSENMLVLPAVSSVSEAFAHAGIPWD